MLVVTTRPSWAKTNVRDHGRVPNEQVQQAPVVRVPHVAVAPTGRHEVRAVRREGGSGHFTLLFDACDQDAARHVVDACDGVARRNSDRERAAGG